MKSKTGTLKLCLFLFSISCYTGLFSQAPLRYTSISNHTADLIVTKAASAGLFPTLTNFTSSLSDTTRKNDRDGDGIVDSLDKCPDEKGVIQYDGCPVPDSDNDGIADDIDACPTIAGTLKYKGCPPTDTDGDKISDEDDKCPNQAGVARYDGCPIGDKDGDGVNDDDDKCIDVKGSVNNAGCPESKKPTSVSKGKKKS